MSEVRHRDVALGVINLGNTCYMNAVLQALAHAPELCLALDYEPHHRTCPIALENEKRRRHRRCQQQQQEEEEQQQKQLQQQQQPEYQINEEKENANKRKRLLEAYNNLNHNSRKSRRSGKKSPALADRDNSRFDDEFCILCSLEEHLERVHAQHQQEQAISSGGEPVIPDAFVHGFVEQVAPPSFRLGVQEDSHEFLRLLIEAMQKASILAYSKAHPLPQESLTTKHNPDHDELYPFKLFRGTVESNVRCLSCGFRNATIDPIEDIGLEVTRTSSGSSLSDLHTAFQRFTREEPLTEYKCDRCGQMGNATKQSRLASIPPILTLHLKRFRYGTNENYHGSHSSLPPRRSRGDASSHLVGSSGSAKIEGHSKFLEIFDLKPYLTEDLSRNVKNMFCRLFAVVVHAGKNSHSGHYIAYVRNISKNEWWKMDDARVLRVSSQEVLNAEAYMLFYRVVDHPIAQDLRAKQQQMQEQQQQQQDAELTSSDTIQPNTPTPPPQAEELSNDVPEISSTPPPIVVEPTPIIPTDVTTMPATFEEESNNTSTMNTCTSSDNVKSLSDPTIIVEDMSGAAKEVAIDSIFSAAISDHATKRQRSIPQRKILRPQFLNGTSWAKAHTKLSTESISLIERAEEHMASKMEFTPKFLQELQKGRNPAMTEADFLGGLDSYRRGLQEFMFQLVRWKGGLEHVLCIQEEKEKKNQDEKNNINKKEQKVVLKKPLSAILDRGLKEKTWMITMLDSNDSLL